MEIFDYLSSFKNCCDIDSLKKVKEERDPWTLRKNTKELWEKLNRLPSLSSTPTFDSTGPDIKIGKKEDLSEEQYNKVLEQSKSLIPWKKGPFDLFGIKIDGEWRSDFKWARLEKALGSLKGRKILDIGCNNGYFIFKMLGHNPEMVLGLDPVVRCLLQFKLIQSFTNFPNTFFELWGVEHVKYFRNFFDDIFYMGIIYHHKNPIEQLTMIKEALKPGGRIIFETIGIPGESPHALFPDDRYAKMKNVWFIPTLSCSRNWLKKAKFKNIQVISSSELNFKEQRNTDWCPPPHQTLKDFLDPNDFSKTIEGHPAPMRFCIIAEK